MWDTAETVGVLSVHPLPTPSYWSSFARIEAVARQGRDRLDQTVESLTNAGVPFSLIGGKAVAAWISSVEHDQDMGLRNIDVLIRKQDASRAIAALDVFGYPHRKYRTQILLRNSDKSWDRATIRLAYAGVKIGTNDLRPLPDPDQSCMVEGYRCLNLQALAELLLATFRTIDRVHLRSLAEVDLVNADWLTRLEPELAKRLNDILDDPHG